VLAVKGLPCAEEIQLERHLINLVEALGLVGKRGFLTTVVVKESGLHTFNYPERLSNPLVAKLQRGLVHLSLRLGGKALTLG
jgi:hypothetical protein